MPDIVYWVGGVAVPLVLAFMAAVIRHMVNVHSLEVDLRGKISATDLNLQVKTAYLEGNIQGLTSRVTRIEDMLDYGGPFERNKRAARDLTDAAADAARVVRDAAATALDVVAVAAAKA